MLLLPLTPSARDIAGNAGSIASIASAFNAINAAIIPTNSRSLTWRLAGMDCSDFFGDVIGVLWLQNVQLASAVLGRALPIAMVFDRNMQITGMKAQCNFGSENRYSQH